MIIRFVAALMPAILMLPTLAAEMKANFSKAPGVVIAHSPAASGLYIGSPSIAILPNGDYLASHDHFGPKSAEFASAMTKVYRSADRGKSWAHLATIQGAFWSSLFVHRDDVYLIGPTKHHGNVVIRRSTDGGNIWTTPHDGASGLLLEGEYHCAPMPVIEHAGRLWRAMEDASGGTQWGKRYRAMMMSAPADADLLNAKNWTRSNSIPRDAAWLGGKFNAWLEGNAVVTPDGKMVNILRVDAPLETEYAAVVQVSDDGRTATFDADTGFVPFPGGSKKFAIRFDATTKLYWTLSNFIPPRHISTSPASTRNTLALASSPDLREWTVRCVLLYHPDRAKHGFQYVDWLFDGEDMVAACRTAFDDGLGGARNNHDANLLTFHRIAGFRKLTMADSVAMPEAAQVRHETADLIITGSGFAIASLDDGKRAFSNREYVWENVRERFRGWQYTQTAGGERAELRVQAKKDLTLLAATAGSQQGLEAAGWKPLAESFSYTDRGHSRLVIHERRLRAGESIAVPQSVWAGMVVLIAP